MNKYLLSDLIFKLIIHAILNVKFDLIYIVIIVGAFRVITSTITVVINKIIIGIIVHRIIEVIWCNKSFAWRPLLLINHFYKKKISQAHLFDWIIYKVSSEISRSLSNNVRNVISNKKPIMDFNPFKWHESQISDNRCRYTSLPPWIIVT